MEIENTVCIFPFENFQPLLVGVIFNQLKFYKVNNGFFKNSNHLQIVNHWLTDVF